MLQSEDSSHQSAIGNQSSKVSTALPIATLAHTGIQNAFLSYSGSSSWIIDSGASTHMIGKSSLFSLCK